MATVTTPRPWENGYPTWSKYPMPETDWHRDLMFALIEVLKAYFAGAPLVYVSGNLLIFYEPGNKRKHVSPDVFVVRGVAKHDRPNYLVWEEGKGPELVIELTSKTTRKQDLEKKFQLYRDVLKVQEYFLFDPLGDYLKPRLQGFRLRAREYHPIRPVADRLPSKVVGLHLEPNGRDLRLYDPATGKWLPTPQERVEQAEQEIERLRREVAELRRGRDGTPPSLPLE
jgi:Uma2 family endonuclease